MVAMQMRQQDGVDLFRPSCGRAQAAEELSSLVGAERVARARVDEDQP